MAPTEEAVMTAGNILTDGGPSGIAPPIPVAVGSRSERDVVDQGQPAGSMPAPAEAAKPASRRETLGETFGRLVVLVIAGAVTLPWVLALGWFVLRGVIGAISGA
jgi:hypothetical protein